jgi:hypothetical protein
VGGPGDDAVKSSRCRSEEATLPLVSARYHLPLPTHNTTRILLCYNLVRTVDLAIKTTQTAIVWNSYQ